MPGRDADDWSVGEIVRAVLRLEKTTGDDITRLRQRQEDHEKTHVSKEAFDSLRNTLRSLAFLVLTQIAVIVGGLIYYALTNKP